MSRRQMPGKGRLPALEGLRGAAAAMVFLVHYTSPINPWLGGPHAGPVSTALGGLGNRGVDLFFALSGYLIYASLIRRPQPVGVYARRRIMRLYPAFLAVLALYLALGTVMPGETLIPPGWLPGAAYLAANVALLPGVFPIPPIIGVAWSLSYEAAFYVLVPLFIALLRLRRWSPVARAALILAIPVGLQLGGVVPPRASLFACGMLLAEAAPLLRRHGAWLGLLGLAALPLCAVVLLGAGPEPMERPLAFWAVFVTSFALCGSAVGERGIVAAALGFRPLRWLGTISYSFYLLHGVMLHAFFIVAARAHLPPGLGWPMLLPAFAVSLAGSFGLFWLVERRFSFEPVRPVAIPEASPPRNPSPLHSPSCP